VQLVEQSTSDPKFEGSNPATVGTGRGKLWRGKNIFPIKSHFACLVCPLHAVSFMFSSINIGTTAIVQLVEQSTNDTKFDGSNPAATGSGKGKLQRGKNCFPINGLYYKLMTIVNDDSRAVNKLEASLTDDTRVVIYDRHMFIVQATKVTAPPSPEFSQFSV
jgi:hypothetical protein